MRKNLENTPTGPPSTGFKQPVGPGTSPESQLFISAQELWALVEPLAQALWETDAKGQVLLDSPSWRAYTGQPIAQWLKEGWTSTVHPHEQTQAIGQWQEALRQRTPFQAELRITTPDGHWQWTTLRAIPVYQPDGSVGRWLGLSLNIQDRKQAHEARQKTEESLRAAAMGTYVWYIDEDRGEPDAQMLTLFGLPTDSTLNMASALGTLIHAEDGPRYAQAVAKAADPAGSGLLRQDIRVIHPDGQERWLTIRGQMHFTGRPRRAHRLVGSAIDITERKQAEQNLKLMLQGATAAICMLQSIRDEQGHIIDFLYQGGNRAAEKILGQSVESMVGKTLLQLWPKVKDIFFDSYVQVVETGEPFRVENYYAQEGFNHWFEISGEKNGDGFVMTFLDVTPQKKAEARQHYLLQLGDRLRSLADPIQIQYQAACVLGKYLGANRVGYAAGQGGGHILVVAPNYTQGVLSLEGRYQFELYSATMLADLLTGQVVMHPDVANDPRLTAGEKAAHQANQIGAALTHPLVKEGELVAVLFIHYQLAHAFSAQELELVQETAERTWDAVERAKAEAALRLAGQRKDEFLALLAHELRNPLATLSNALLLLETSRGADEQLPLEMLSGMMSREMAHLIRLVDDLLDISRISLGTLTLRRQAVDLTQLVDQAVGAVGPVVESAHLQLRVQVPDHPVMILGDADRLTQVLRNLLGNAVKFTPAGGQLTLILEPVGDEAVVRVTDTGIGLAESDLIPIFTMFAQVDGSRTRAQGGLGLGLTLVQDIIRLHGGRVEARSEGLGQGSEFILFIPLTATSGSLRPWKADNPGAD